MKQTKTYLLTTVLFILFNISCAPHTKNNYDTKNLDLAEYNKRSLNYLLSDMFIINSGILSPVKFSELSKNYESIKIILKFDSLAKVYILKKDTQSNWDIKNLKFSRTQSPAELMTPPPNKAVQHYLVLAKNNLGFDSYWRNGSGFSEDQGISAEKFETYMKDKTEYWKEFFPDGYTRQLDENGNFIAE